MTAKLSQPAPGPELELQYIWIYGSPLHPTAAESSRKLHKKGTHPKRRSESLLRRQKRDRLLSFFCGCMGHCPGGWAINATWFHSLLHVTAFVLRRNAHQPWSSASPQRPSPNCCECVLLQRNRKCLRLELVCGGVSLGKASLPSVRIPGLELQSSAFVSFKHAQFGVPQTPQPNFLARFSATLACIGGFCLQPFVPVQRHCCCRMICPKHCRVSIEPDARFEILVCRAVNPHSK